MPHEPKAAPFVTMFLLVACTALAARAHAASGGLEVGFGAMRTAPYVVGGVVCASLSGEFRHALPARPLAARVEARWALGGDVAKGTLEAARGGNQSLATLIAGAELHSPSSPRGVFVDLGVGIGRSTISGARGRTEPQSSGLVPLYDRTAAAYGFGLGYRFGNGSAWPPEQLALRSIGLAHGLAGSWATTTTLGLGLSF